jgi:peptide/nickel transport system substrate-binding protein
MRGVVFGVFLLAVASCSDSGGRGTAALSTAENTLRYDVCGPILSLHPIKEKASASTLVFPFLFSYLFILNEAGELEPDLAVSWSYDSKSIWTIHLRADARFHDGRPVTSRDVVYSLTAMLSTIRPSLYSIVESITPFEDTGVRIALKKDDPELLRKIAALEIVPETVGDHADDNDSPVGSGPFKLGYRHGEDELCLIANEDYYGGRPSLDRVIFYHIANREKSWARLLSGKTDVAQEIYPTDYKIIRDGLDRFHFDIRPRRSYAILLYNVAHPLFSDPRVRVALSHAIDRDRIVKDVLQGFGVVASGPMGVDSPFHNPEVKSPDNNPRRSLELLEEAGWSTGDDGRYLEKDGIPFEFTIIYPAGYQTESSVVEFIQFYLQTSQQIGFFLKLKCAHRSGQLESHGVGWSKHERTASASSD